MTKHLLTISTFSALLLLVIGLPVSAQTNLTVSPVLHEASLSPGSNNSGGFVVSLRNVSNSTESYTVSFRDFRPTSDGTPDLLPTGESVDKYGLSTYMNGKKSLTIGPSQVEAYMVEVSIPDNVEHGTYYGAAVFSRAGSSPSSPTSSAASLFVVDVGESSTPPILIEGLNSSESSFEDPSSARAVLEMDVRNSGSFATKPTLSVTVVDGDGTTVATLEPENDGYILPQSKRTFTFVWSADSFDADKDYYAVPHIELEDGTVVGGDSEKTSLYTAPVEQATEEPAATNYWPWVGIAGGTIALLALAGVVAAKFHSAKKKKSQEPATTSPPEHDNQEHTFSTDSEQ